MAVKTELTARGISQASMSQSSNKVVTFDKMRFSTYTLILIQALEKCRLDGELRMEGDPEKVGDVLAIPLQFSYMRESHCIIR